MSTLEQKQLLELVSYALFGGEKKNTSMSPAVLKEARQQAVLTLLEIPPTISPSFYTLQAQLLDKNLRVDDQHAQIHRLMKNAGIPYVILKGSASASYYPEPLLRTMGDTDILVATSDLSRVDAVLREDGFCIKNEDDHEAHCAYTKQTGSVCLSCEVHWQLAGIPEGKIGEQIRVYLSDMITSAKPHPLLVGECMFPTDFHHGLVMLIHVARHLIHTGIGLRHLCDWAVFVAKFSDGEFCEIFEEKLKTVGLWRFAQLLTQLSIKYLNCPKKEWCGVGDETYLEKMMEDVLNGGNFGVKDLNRINQAKLMTNDAKGNVDNTGLLKQLYLTMNEKARRGMPIIDKVPFLLPIGWIYVGGRHLVRIVQKKRPRIHVKNMIDGATERKEIYKEFQLFEVE